jgi:hypothetical protein
MRDQSQISATVSAATKDKLDRGAHPGALRARRPDLDRFFEHYAGQNQFNLHLAVTYAVHVEGRILGFATVAPSSIERASVPSARPRKRLPSYPLPASKTAIVAHHLFPAGVTSQATPGPGGTRTLEMVA